MQMLHLKLQTIWQEIPWKFNLVVTALWIKILISCSTKVMRCVLWWSIGWKFSKWNFLTNETPGYECLLSLFFRSIHFMNYILVNFFQFVIFQPIHRISPSRKMITVLHLLFRRWLIKMWRQQLLQNSVLQVMGSTREPSTLGSTPMAGETI